MDSVWKQTGDQIYVGYAPDIRNAAKTSGDQDNEEHVANAAGYLTVNEALKEFPDLKRKYKTSYDYYVSKNKYEEDGDYTEAFSYVRRLKNKSSLNIDENKARRRVEQTTTHPRVSTTSIRPATTCFVTHC